MLKLLLGFHFVKLLNLTYTISQKNRSPFCDNFSKSGPIFIIFTFKLRKYLRRKLKLKTTTSPQICCRSTLWNINGQLYSFTAQLIQFKMMQRRLITVSVHEDAISLFVYIDFYHMFKMAAFISHHIFML